MILWEGAETSKYFAHELDDSLGKVEVPTKTKHTVRPVSFFFLIVKPLTA